MDQVLAAANESGGRRRQRCPEHGPYTHDDAHDLRREPSNVKLCDDATIMGRHGHRYVQTPTGGPTSAPSLPCLDIGTIRRKRLLDRLVHFASHVSEIRRVAVA